MIQDLASNKPVDKNDIDTAEDINNNTQFDKHLQRDIQRVLDQLKNSEYNSANSMTNWQKYVQENEEASKNISQMVQEAVKRGFEKIKGNLPGGAVEYLKKILKIEIDWADILSRALNTALEKTQSKRWSYPNIYYRHIGYFPSDDYEETVQNITCFVDTSGSMSDRELQKIFGIIYDLIEQNDIKTVTIVQHDYDLQLYDVIETDEISDSEDLVKRIRIKGRGGTSHVNPIKKFHQLIDEDEIPYPDLVIFMSDFESDFEQAYEKYIKQQDYGIYCITTHRIPNVKDAKTFTLKIRD